MITIYRIVNKVTGDQYIGSTVNYPSRVSKHKSMLRCGNHRNRYLQEAYDSLGPDCLSYEIIEQFEDDSLRFEREQHWMDTVRSSNSGGLYNILPIAGKARGRIHFESTKMRMSATAKGRRPSDATIAAAIEYRRLNPYSADTLARRAEALRKAAKRGEQSDKAKLSEAQVVEIISRLKRGELQKDVAQEYGVAKSTLSHIWLGHTWSHIDRDAI
jgi:group I intron endonuclease